MAINGGSVKNFGETCLSYIDALQIQHTVW
jgi:hypothetical protein